MTVMHTRYRVEDERDLCEKIAAAAAARTPVYPVGGGTSLDFGAPARQAGMELELTRLDRVVDYPAADMTITVGAGIRISALQQVLARHQQQLPLDVPLPTQATLGGVLATNFSGPRRLGYGTARDYVIGIRAVDGRGEAFAAGGRVVKNVAGYDFCKLLIGALGTVGVISEVTLKLKPLPETVGAIIAAPRDEAQRERLLARLVTHSRVQPTAVELLVGDGWSEVAQAGDWPTSQPHVGWIVLYLEGFAAEVRWMAEQLAEEWALEPGLATCSLTSAAARDVLDVLTEFPAQDQDAILLHASMLPSSLEPFLASVRACAPQAMIQAHAGSGIVRVAFREPPQIGLDRAVTTVWRPLLAQTGGHLVVMAHPARAEMTPAIVWGQPATPAPLLRRVRQAFDPQDILNPGRFCYGEGAGHA